MNQNTRLLRLFALAALLLAANSVKDDPAPPSECNGHGTLDAAGICTCTTPLPQLGQLGFVGDNCTTPVFSYALNAPDISVGLCKDQAAAPDGLPCDTLVSGSFTPRCFAVDMSDLRNGTSNNVALLFTNTHSNSTLRVRGFLADFGATPVEYPRWSQPFAFTLALPAGGAPAHYQLSRHLSGTNRNGLFVCYYNGRSGDEAKVGLKLASSKCPVKLLDDGTPSVCSSTAADMRHDEGDTCADNWCTCKAPHARPDVQVDAASGFPECSATLTPLAFDPAAAVNFTSAEVKDHMPGTWQYFSLPVYLTDFEISARAYATAVPADGVLHSTLELFLRYYQPPGRTAGQYAVTDTKDDWTPDQAAGLRLTRDNAAFAQAALVWQRTSYAATWYIGAYVSGTQPITYKLDVLKFGCPNDCSGAGKCMQGVCVCDSELFSGPECARAPATLKLDEPFTVAPRSGGSHAGGFLDALTLPGAKALLGDTGRTAALQVKVKTTYGALTIPAWVYSRPALIVSRNGPLTIPEEASSRLPLLEAGTVYTLEVDAGMVDEADLHFSIANPFSHPYKVGYEVTVSRVGHCLNGCTGEQGTCGTDGVCTCKEGFSGGDCSAAFSSRVCAAGSLQPEVQADKFATCWHPCKDDGSGFDTQLCAEFVCNDVSADGRPLRRKALEQECVSDTCLPGTTSIVTVKDLESNCQKACVCPEGGAACALADTCAEGSLQCLNGFTKKTQPERCEPISGCVERDLKLAFSVASGAAYAVCLCDPSGCHFSSPTRDSLQQAVVTCEPKHQLQGTKSDVLRLQDGKYLASGGRCASAGLGGGWVFFWCLFSVALAVGLAFGGKWAVVRWELHRYGLASGYGDAWDHFTNSNKAPLNDRW